MPYLLSILLLGATGQVGGHALREPLASVGAVIAPTRQDADLTYDEALRALIRRTAPDVIINTAACTVVDQAEEGPVRTQAINGTAPDILAEKAARQGRGSSTIQPFTCSTERAVRPTLICPNGPA
jgi:dTDP-4-dehydrorhamnose reductase